MSLWIVADHTLREAVRRRVVLAAAVVIGGFLALYGVGVWFGYRDISTDPDLTASMQRVIVGFMLQGGMWSLNLGIIYVCTHTAPITRPPVAAGAGGPAAPGSAT